MPINTQLKVKRNICALLRQCSAGMHTNIQQEHLCIAAPMLSWACTQCVADTVPRHAPAAAARAGARARGRAGLGRAPPGSTPVHAVAVFVAVVAAGPPERVAAALRGARPALSGRQQACAGTQEHIVCCIGDSLVVVQGVSVAGHIERCGTC